MANLKYSFEKAHSFDPVFRDIFESRAVRAFRTFYREELNSQIERLENSYHFNLGKNDLYILRGLSGGFNGYVEEGIIVEKDTDCLIWLRGECMKSNLYLPVAGYRLPENNPELAISRMFSSYLEGTPAKAKPVQITSEEVVTNHLAPFLPQLP